MTKFSSNLILIDVFMLAISEITIPRVLPPKDAAWRDVITVDGCKEQELSRLNVLEHVQVYVKMNTRYRGDIEILLTSPASTKSQLLSPRPRDDYSGDWDFTFMTVHHWGEDPAGDWTIQIHDTNNSHRNIFHEFKSTDQPTVFNKKLSNDNSGNFIYSWNLILEGTLNTIKNLSRVRAYHPTQQELESIKRSEFQLSRNIILSKHKKKKHPVKGWAENDVLKNLNSKSQANIIDRAIIDSKSQANITDRVVLDSESLISEQKRYFHKEALDSGETIEIEQLTDEITQTLEEMLTTV